MNNHHLYFVLWSIYSNYKNCGKIDTIHQFPFDIVQVIGNGYKIKFWKFICYEQIDVW